MKKLLDLNRLVDLLVKFTHDHWEEMCPAERMGFSSFIREMNCWIENENNKDK